jgi:hypothetical protein
MRWSPTGAWASGPLPGRGGVYPPAAEALDLLEAKRRPDGRWNAEGRRYGRPPGSAGSNVEVLDRGPSRPSELVTLNALRVLRAAGRGCQ